MMTAEESEPFDFVIGPLTADGPPACPATQYPCAGCEQPIWLSNGGLAIMARDHAKPACPRCALTFAEPGDEVVTRCRHPDCGSDGVEIVGCLRMVVL